MHNACILIFLTVSNVPVGLRKRGGGGELSITLQMTYLTFPYYKVGSNSVGVSGGGPPQADFVPHIARHVLAPMVLCPILCCASYCVLHHISKKVWSFRGPSEHYHMLTIRISRLLEVKLGRKVPPRPIVAGEPLLTVRSVTH